MAPSLYAAALAAVALAAASFPANVFAQVPPDIAAQNKALGTRIDVASAIRTYTPVEEQPPYPASEARITRDIAYGPDARNRLDVFAPPKPSSHPLPVVLFATGGDFTRKIDLPGGAPFYDNVVLWAAKHGLIGVNTDRRHFRGRTWQVGPEDMAGMIGWVHAHIAEYGGDPNRVLFLGHAYGGTQLISYLAHPQYWCCDGQPGIAAAAIVSAPLNLQPATPAPAAGRAPNPLFDPQHSDLTGLSHIHIPIYIGSAEFEGAQQKQSAQLLRQQLCATGHCPPLQEFRDHNHLSVMFSFNTPDSSVSGPILRWFERAVPARGPVTATEQR